MAVPTGDYELAASVDLSPLFGVVEANTTVSVTRPDAGVLDARLREISDGDPNVRLRAVRDLRYFPREGERIVPVLVELLKGDDANLRSSAVSVFYAFPKEAVEHLDLFVSIMGGTGSESERGTAAYLIARFAPSDAKYEKAITDAVESAEGNLKRRFEGALLSYQRRHKVAKPAGNSGS